MLSSSSIDWWWFGGIVSIICQSTQLNRALQFVFDAPKSKFESKPNFQKESKSNIEQWIVMISTTTLASIIISGNNHSSSSLPLALAKYTSLNSAPSMLGWLIWYPKKRPRQSSMNMMGWLQCSCCINTLLVMQHHQWRVDCTQIYQYTWRTSSAVNDRLAHHHPPRPRTLRWRRHFS